MARIRSVHPGLFTDEAFASCSPHAQVLFIGIWTECDDNGVFEWKPITLKMRLRPAADVDCGDLLDELASNGMIKPITVGGKSLGLVRNFCKFQRPKKPKAWHVLPPEFRTYVGLSEDSSELGGDERAGVPKKGELDAVQGAPVPKKSEKSPQMEDGGGRIDPEPNGSEAAAAAPVDLKSEIFGTCLRWLAAHSDIPSSKLRSLVGKWCSNYGDAAVLDAMTRAARDGPVDPVAWITKSLQGSRVDARKRTVESDRRAILKGLNLGPDGRPLDGDHAGYPTALAVGY